jgi:peptide subunit release factor 1 (eRF1)
MAHIHPHEPQTPQKTNKQEKKLLQRYFDEISQDTGKYCFMVEDTLKGLELGAVEILIVWEGLETMRYVCGFVWLCWGEGGV